MSADEPTGALGARIMELRKFKGLSQAQLGKLMGLSQPALANYEKGQRDPPATFLISLCEEFGVSPSWLLQGVGNMLTQPSDKHYARAIRIAWTYLLGEHGSVDQEKLTSLGNALFHYLMEHGELSETMENQIVKVAA